MVHARTRAVVVRSTVAAVLGARVLAGVNEDGPSPGPIVSASVALRILLAAAVAYAIITVASAVVPLRDGPARTRPSRRRSA